MNVIYELVLSDLDHSIVEIDHVVRRVNVEYALWYDLWYKSSPSASESPSGVLLVLSGILSDQAKKLERMAILQAWAWLPRDHAVKKFSGWGHCKQWQRRQELGG